jgi:hypothetical protein
MSHNKIVQTSKQQQQAFCLSVISSGAQGSRAAISLLLAIFQKIKTKKTTRMKSKLEMK